MWQEWQRITTNDDLADYALTKDLSVSRVVKTTHIEAHDDVAFSAELEIFTELPQKKEGGIAIIITEGARPLTTWGCIPVCFYNSSLNKYMVHNIGDTADNIEISYVVLYQKA